MVAARPSRVGQRTFKDKHALAQDLANAAMHWEKVPRFPCSSTTPPRSSMTCPLTRSRPQPATRASRTAPGCRSANRHSVAAAEGEGFEPPRAWRPLRFSRPLRSTTPASLRGPVHLKAQRWNLGKGKRGATHRLYQCSGRAALPAHGQPRSAGTARISSTSARHRRSRLCSNT